MIAESRILQQLKSYAVIFTLALIARCALSVIPFEYISNQQATVWSWPFFGVLACCLFLGAVFARSARMPDPEEAFHDRRRWIFPVLAGAGIGLLLIGSDIVSPAAAARGLQTLHVRGMAAVPFYVYGAILLTVVFHFLPMAFAAWLARRMRKASRIAIVIAGVLVVAFSEDLSYFRTAPPLFTIETARHVLSVIANAAEACFIYHYGLVAGLLQRGTTYLLWHLLWPRV